MGLQTILADPRKAAAFTTSLGDRQEINILELYAAIFPYIAEDFRLKRDDVIEKTQMMAEINANIGAVNSMLSSHVHPYVNLTTPATTTPSGTSATVTSAFQSNPESIVYQSMVYSVPVSTQNLQTPTGEIPAKSFPRFYRIPFASAASSILAPFAKFIEMAKALSTQAFEV